MQLLIRRLNIYIKELVYRNIEGKKVLFLFILTNLVYGFMLLFTIPKVMGYSGGMKIFDMLPMGYQPEYAGLLLEKLGVAGRNVYLYYQIPIDLLYPFLFGITYCLLLAYLLNQIQHLKAVYFYLCILPLLAGLFDYLENFCIINLLVSYPQVSEGSIQISSFFTVIKSLLSTISFTVIIAVLIILVFKKIVRKK